MNPRFVPAVSVSFVFGAWVAGAQTATPGTVPEPHAAHAPAPAAMATPASAVPVVAVEGQPLGANVQRVVDALDLVGAPLPAALRAELTQAAAARDAQKLQALLDDRVLLVVHLNPGADTGGQSANC